MTRISRLCGFSLSMISAAWLCVSLTGCVVGPKYHPPSAPTPVAPDYQGVTADLAAGQGWKVASPHDQMLHGKWWEIFNEPELNALEDQLNINNQNIKFFFESYLAARAVIREARSQYYPTVSVGAGFTRSKAAGNLANTGTTGTGGTSGTTNNGATLSTFNTPLDISWAPDIFGRVRSTVRSNQAAAQVSEADLENERLLEQATLAETYF